MGIREVWSLTDVAQTQRTDSNQEPPAYKNDVPEANVFFKETGEAWPHAFIEGLLHSDGTLVHKIVFRMFEKLVGGQRHAQRSRTSYLSSLIVAFVSFVACGRAPAQSPSSTEQRWRTDCFGEGIRYTEGCGPPPSNWPRLYSRTNIVLLNVVLFPNEMVILFGGSVSFVHSSSS